MNSDAFALLNEPWRPWLEVEPLKARFIERSAEAHPDRVHSASEAEKQSANSRYAELNAAFNTLKEPRDRLRHLYELETGAPPKDIQRIPPGTMDLFVEVGQTCRDGDEFLRQKAAATSPMMKLQVMQEGLDWLARFQSLQQRVNARRDELVTELKLMNRDWETAPPPGTLARKEILPLERLEQIYRAMSYVERWTSQLQERLVQLTF